MICKCFECAHPAFMTTWSSFHSITNALSISTVRCYCIYLTFWSCFLRSWSSKSSWKNFWIERILTSDGEFYMSFDDYLKYFGDIEIVHLNPIRKNIFHPPKNFIFKIEWWSWNWENICFTFYLGCITMRKDLWANLQSKDL